MITFLAIELLVFYFVFVCKEIIRFMYRRKWLKEHDPVHPLIREHYNK